LIRTLVLLGMGTKYNIEAALCVTDTCVGSWKLARVAAVAAVVAAVAEWTVVGSG